MKRKSCWIEESFSDSNLKNVATISAKGSHLSGRCRKTNKNDHCFDVRTNSDFISEKGLWCDNLTLYSTSKLCIHPKKVKELRETIESYRNKTSIILVKGPSGCGKSSLITAICKELNLGLKRFELSAGCSIYSDEVSQDSEYNEFKQFLFSDFSAGFASFSLDSPRHSVMRPAVLWLPELPNVFVHSLFKLENLLSEFLTSGAGQHPVIVELSDYSQSKIRGFSQSFHFRSNFTVVSMNSIAPTFMKKGLLLLRNFLPKSAKCQLNDSLLKHVSDISNGDMRLAINNLQLLSCFNSSKKSIISSKKDFTIGIFHSIGKLLYPKRDQCSIRKKCALGPLVTPVDQVVDFCSVTSEFLLSTLEENISKVLHDVEQYSRCLDDFLVSDQINVLKFTSNFQAPTLENVSSLTCASSVVFWTSFGKTKMQNEPGLVQGQEFAPIRSGLKFTNRNNSKNGGMKSFSANRQNSEGKSRDMEILDCFAPNSYIPGSTGKGQHLSSYGYRASWSYSNECNVYREQQLFANDAIIDECELIGH